MAVEKVRPIDRILEIIYSFAAVPVLLGALFKITHTAPFGSANGWLNFGLYTEAFVFTSFGLLYLFAPPKAVDEMGVPTSEQINEVSNNTKGSSSLNAMDKMLLEAGITPDSLEKLSAGFKSLEANISRISGSANSVVNTELYAQKLNEATASLSSLNSFYNKLAETSQALVNSAEDAKRTQEQIGALAENLQKLNQVYGGMLTAMKGSKS